MPKINENGTVRELTKEEIVEIERDMQNAIQPEPTQEERLSALEAENAQLKEAINLLLSKISV